MTTTRGHQSRKLRRRPCPSDCACLCHDTNGGITIQHGEHGVCPPKLGLPLLPLRTEPI